jgi:hypothetical protein
VSRWSVERLRIGLAPERVDLARLRVGLRREPVRQHGAACAPRAGEPAWQPALDALDQSLAAFDLRGGSATAVLSNHWVRYAVLAWQPEVTAPAEVRQLARLRFEHTFGAAAAGWEIRICDGGYGRPYVACAVDAALIAELRARLQRHGVRLASLQPLLMAAFNEVRRQLAGSAALVIVEPGRVCLGLTDGERWLDISSRRVGDDPATAVEQELATMDAASVPTRIDVMLVGDGAAWSERTERPARLLGRPAGAGRRSLAMCGVA